MVLQIITTKKICDGTDEYHHRKSVVVKSCVVGAALATMGAMPVGATTREAGGARRPLDIAAPNPSAQP